MASPGKTVRLGRIFRDNGKTLIVPIDHGLASGPVRGLENPAEMVNTLVSSGVDAILTTYGIATRYAHLFANTSLVLRIDGGPSDFSKDPEATGLMCTVADALRIGADAVISSIWLGGAHEARSMSLATTLAGECEAWGMPLIIETFMSSELDPTVNNIALVSRIAAELGADIVKTYFRGDVKDYQQITNSCFRPIVILGGEKTGDPLQVLKWVKTAVDAGAAGSCIGRNVFQHENPGGLIKALKAIIHENAGIDDVSHLV